MGGLAVSITWAGPTEADRAAQMLSTTPFRATAGLRSVTTHLASLAEGRTHEDDPAWNVVSHGRSHIVADVRLWRRGRLRNVAGGAAATDGLDDRALILAAYTRSGWARTLDAIDGDFAFVIWDDARQVAIAARDRFGVMPLFFSHTPTGIAFATEPKHLTHGSRNIEPDVAAVAAYLAGRPVSGRSTYLDSISRVMPAEVISASARTTTYTRYWDPEPGDDTALDENDVPHLYREHLVEAVERRLGASSTTVSQLSGGLDSTSIAASAQILTENSGDLSRFATVSAAFPGSTADESSLIDDVVARQPFAHHTFVFDRPEISRIIDAMGRTDRPQISPTYDLETGTGRYGESIGADLLLTGTAGDDLIDDADILVDLLEQRQWRRWRQAIRTRTAASGHRPMSLALPSLISATPPKLKGLIRRTLPDRSSEPIDLMSDDLRARVAESGPDDLAAAYPSRTQRAVIQGACSSRTAQLNEYIEARMAPFGIGVSHPHLDRSLIEFVASIPVPARPIDGRTKTIVRHGFADLLPPSVIERQHKAKADDYFVDVLNTLMPAIRERFPVVGTNLEHIIDPDRYRSVLLDADRPEGDLTRFRRLWPAWTTLAWFEKLSERRT